MSLGRFKRQELTAALARGVRQLVVIGSRPALDDGCENSRQADLQMFTVQQEQLSEPLATALEQSNFDRHKAGLFVWLGSAGYRTAEAAVGSLAYIASLPQGSGVLLDYVVERTSLRSLTETALDALASRMPVPGKGISYRIQPQAVAAMLRGLGFRQVQDLAEEGHPLSGGHLVSALV